MSATSLTFLFFFFFFFFGGGAHKLLARFARITVRTEKSNLSHRGGGGGGGSCTIAWSPQML